MEEGSRKEAAPVGSFKIQLKTLSIPLLKLRVIEDGKEQKLQLEDDEYLYCRECNELHVGECHIHGPLTWVKDNMCTNDDCTSWGSCSDSSGFIDDKDNEEAKDKVNPNSDEDAKDTVNPNSDEEEAKDTVNPNRDEDAKDTVNPDSDEDAKDTVNPDSDEEQAKDTVNPNSDEEEAKDTVNPNSDEDAKDTVNPDSDEEEAKDTVNPGSDEEEAKDTVNPDSDEEEAKDTVNPNSNEEAKDTVNPDSDEEEAKDTVNPNNDEEQAKYTVNPNSDEEEAKDTVNPGSDEEAKDTLNPESDEEEAMDTINPGSDEEAKDTVNPESDEEEAKDTVNPGSDEEAKDTVNPESDEEEAKGMVNPDSDEEQAKDTVNPESDEEEAKGMVNPESDEGASMDTSKNCVNMVYIALPKKPHHANGCMDQKLLSMDEGESGDTKFYVKESTNPTCFLYTKNLREPNSVAADFADGKKLAVDMQTKARQSFPAGVEPRVSSIPDAGLGAFAVQRFDNKVVFGPYEGKKMQLEDILPTMNQNYMWDVIEGGTVSHVVDAADEEDSNWMRFVNCARHEDEQNLVAFQYRGNIYYRTFKTIEPGDELLVWYGDEYACNLDILKDGISTTDSSLSCQKCCIVFNGPSFLARHTKFRCQINNKRLRWRCLHCGKSFKNKRNYSIHKNIHTGIKPYPCAFCSRVFSHPSSRKRHENRHRGDKQHRCQKCGFCFNYDTSLRRHMKTVHTVQNAFKCRHCPATFALSFQVRRHQQLHASGQLTYKCGKCHSMFASRMSLGKHKCVNLSKGCGLGMKKTKEQCPYHCNKCNVDFSSGIGLSNHMRIHRCDSPLKSSSNTGHQQLHASGQLTYKCGKCHSMFASRMSLGKHKCVNLTKGCGLGMKKTKEQCPYHCNKCNVDFSSGIGLSNHMRMHRRDSPLKSSSNTGLLSVASFKCAHCGMCFHRKRSLNVHKRLHAGEKSPSLAPKGKAKLIKCDHCGKTCPSLLSLRSHKGMHFVPQMYPCPVCSKIFLKKQHMFEHLSSHPGKNFKCAWCEKSFYHNKDLSKHTKLHKGQPRKESIPRQEAINPKVRTSLSYNCGQCGVICPSYLSLIRHKNYHAAEKGTPSTRDTVNVQGDHVMSEQVKNEIGQGNSDVERASRRGVKPVSVDALCKEFPNGGGEQIQDPAEVETSFKCDLCIKSFSSQRSLHCHSAVHSRKKFFPPKISSQKISMPPTKRGLENSAKVSVSSNPTNPVPGNVCDHPSPRGQNGAVSGISRGRSWKHKKQSSTVEFHQPFSCTRCKKQFATFFSLRSHNVSHARFCLRSRKRTTRVRNIVDKTRPSPCKTKRLPRQTSGAAKTPIVLPDQKKPQQCSVGRKRSPQSREHGASSQNHIKGDFECTTCNKQYASHKSLYNHKRLHAFREKQGAKAANKKQRNDSDSHPDHPKGCFPCDLCGRRFAESQSLIVHRHYHFPRVYKCPVCSKGLPALFKLRLHLRKHPGQHYKCNICQKEFRVHRTLRSHLIVAHKTTESLLSVRARKEPTKTADQSRQVAKRKQGKLSAGDAVSSRSQSLGSHKIHKQTSVEAVKCHQCDRVFPTTRSLGQHRRARHSVGEANPSVKRTLSQQSEPCKVGIFHSSARPAQPKPDRQDRSCSETTGSTKKKDTYKCTSCDRAFSSYINYCSHIPLHVSQKPDVRCSTNQASKLRSKSLRKRRFINSQLVHAQTEAVQYERPGCEICLKTFKSAVTLKRHIGTHTDEKPYSCSKCDAVFRRKDYIQLHMLRKHNRKTAQSKKRR